MSAKRILFFVGIILGLVFPICAGAAANLTVTPVTWNIIGLDSNDVNVGPQNFAVGARVCNTGDVAATNVTSTFVWDTTDIYINLRPGSLSSFTGPNAIASLAAGSCTDFYYEVQVTRNASAYDHTARYHITATADGLGTSSTPTPRELYVEHLISQNRNGITAIKLNGVAIPAGGSMTLLVGNTYTIELDGGTATQGYNQFESFINFPNTIFQVVSVSTTYSADNSPYVPNPNNKLYADACLWDNDPNSPNYRSCVGGDYKAGGSNVVTSYTVKILSGAGTSQTLNSMFHDFSGSSFHYNADYSTGGVVANIVGPSSVTISKTFTPKAIAPGGTSVMSFKLANPTTETFTGVNFTDTLLGGLKVAATPGVTYSGCGAGAFSPALVANDTSLSFSGGTLNPNSVCTINVNVTAPAGTYPNTTGHLFIDTSLDTGNTGSDTLTASSAPACTAGQTLVSWTVPPATANPPDTATGGAGSPATNNTGSTATASAQVPLSTSINNKSGVNDQWSWETYGYKTGNYVQFVVDTRNYTGVQMSFYLQNTSPSNGPTTLTVSYNNGSGFTTLPAGTLTPPVTTAWTAKSIDFTGLTSTTGTTTFRIAGSGGKNDNAGAALDYDVITFTGCRVPTPPPTITKSFLPKPIIKGNTSTLSFTINNTSQGNTALTGIAFTDVLPAGLSIADSSTTQCAGTLTTTAATRTIALTGGALAAGSSCTINVTVTGTTEGQYNNVSGFISSTQSGPSTNYATDSLTVIAPPAIAKSFSPTSILVSGASTLAFTITNPNQLTALNGIGFTDTLPSGVTATNGTTNSLCGSGSLVITGGNLLTFNGGSLSANSSCTFSVPVTGTTTGTKNNTTSAVTSTEGGNGNTASATLVVSNPVPLIGLNKQISTDNTNWFKFVGVPLPLPQNVYYKFTVSNDGETALSTVSVTDPNVNMASCTPALPSSLAVGVSASCVVGPVSVASVPTPNPFVNTATVTTSTTPSVTSSAKYGTKSLTIAKGVTESSFTAAGDILHYSYFVTNNGGYPLLGPVAVTDNKTTVNCPAVSTATVDLIGTLGDADDYLDPGESIACTATYTVIQADVTATFVTNTASAVVNGMTSPQVSVTVSNIPTRVLLSDFRAYEENGQMVVEWKTASEENTVGFYLLRKDKETGNYRQINKTLMPGLINSRQGGTYRLIDSGASLSEGATYKLIEVESRGRQRTYGPFAVGEDIKPGTLKFLQKEDNAVLHKPEVLSRGEVSQYRREAHGISKAQESRLTARKGVQHASQALRGSRVGEQAKISVTEPGLYYLKASDISAVLGMPEQRVRNMIRQTSLSLSNQGQKVAYFADNGSSGIYFYNQGIDSIYTRKNIYWLNKDSGSEMVRVEGRGPLPAAANETYGETLHFEENLIDAPGLFKDPMADYWFWDYVVAGDPDMGSKAFTLQTNGVAPIADTASLTINLRGGSDSWVNNEHHAIITLNGTRIGETLWQGTDEDHAVTLSFSQSLLKEGDNTIEVAGSLDSGVPYSIFYINSFDLAYERLYRAVDNALLFRGDTNPVVSASGFSNPDILVFEVTDALSPKLIKAVNIDGAAGNYRVSLKPASPGAVYLAIARDAAKAGEVWADVPSSLKDKNNRADYLVITTSGLKDTAASLAAYRKGRGLSPMVVDLEDIMDEYNYGIFRPEAIRDFLFYAYNNWRKAPNYVVLAGDGSYDYKDNLGFGDSVIPPMMVLTPDGLFPSDNYFVANENHIPMMALGRFPASTSQELQGMMDKTITYETASGSAWGSRIVMLADAGEGGLFTAQSDQVASVLPSKFTPMRIYLEQHPVDEARWLLFNELTKGVGLMNYVGHGGLDRFSGSGLLVSDDIGSMTNTGKYPVVTAMTCVVGQFSIPGYPSLAEYLVLKQQGGAVAMWSPTGISIDSEALILDIRFFQHAFKEGNHVLGDVIVKALQDYAQEGNDPSMMDIYTLLGDPALKMRGY